MEALSPAGVTGALLGLVMGWVDYKIAGGIVERKLRDTDRSQTAAERADYERRIQWFRRLLLISTVGVFPVVGYVFGRTIAG
jgi:hypothetical protein